MDLTCFLIDDDQDDHEIFAMALESVDKNYNCITAVNGQDALEKLNTDKTFIPDFIFLDLNMPVMNGKQFLQEIKNLTLPHSIPVVIYTTSSFQKDIEETKKLGASHFLVKPSSIEELSGKLSLLFQNQAVSYLI